jgi:N6-L-threonylcarbamoyladenine synthase
MASVRGKQSKKMRILALETSCDETSVALLDVSGSLKKPSVRLVKHVISSQIDIHAKYGGVVPEVAARTHVAETVSLVSSMIGKKPQTAFDAIAVTYGPGLATALRVGINAAQTLAWLTGKPIVGVNHLEGHMASAWLLPENRRKWSFPALALLVSGGHTELVLMKDFCDYKVVGSTRDDAAGEAFDKSAKLLGLGYPGGPKISKLASKGRDDAFKLPRPMLHEGLDMSFSGLKTAIRNLIEEERKNMSDAKLADICASIEKTIIDVLITKTIRAAKQYQVKSVLLVGGVSANARLRADLTSAVRSELKGVTMLKTAVPFSTDNAAMIAAAGAWRLLNGKTSDWKKMDADPELGL